MKPQQTIRMDEWLAELQRFECDEVPPGFYRPAQLKEQLNLKETKLKRFLRHGLKSGRIETRNFRLMVSNGARLIPHYRIIPEKKK
jgi:hypothetical protein